MSIRTNNIYGVGLEDQPGVAAELYFRSNLVITLSVIIRENKWSLEDAAERLKLSESEVGALLNWRKEEFSCDRLLMCLGELGHLVTIKYDRKTQEIRAEAAPQEI